MVLKTYLLLASSIFAKQWCYLFTSPLNVNLDPSCFLLKGKISKYPYFVNYFYTDCLEQVIDCTNKYLFLVLYIHSFIHSVIYCCVYPPSKREVFQKNRYPAVLYATTKPMYYLAFLNKYWIFSRAFNRIFVEISLWEVALWVRTQTFSSCRRHHDFIFIFIYGKPGSKTPQLGVARVWEKSRKMRFYRSSGKSQRVIWS